MTRYQIDDQLADALRLSHDYWAKAPEGAQSDWRALRDRISEAYLAIAATAPPATDVSREDVTIVRTDGRELQARWYSRGADRPGSAVVYAHGGGMVAGDLDDYDQIISAYVAQAGVPFLSVAYRLSPEGRGAQPTEDLLRGVSWLRDHSVERRVELTRISVMGDSAGAGVAASAAILARDRDIEVARQILVYPMLDDRVTTVSPAIAQFLTWTPEMNKTAWSARVDGVVAPATSPARLEDARHLPSAYIEVGDLDLFRNECLAYALQLSGADVPIELHVHPSVPHDYDLMAPGADVSQRAMRDRIRVLRAL